MNEEILIELGQVSEETKGCQPGRFEQDNEVTHEPC